jgi:2-C-methyl-D-erythritol 4-phosphate cytidylyltransferase
VNKSLFFLVIPAAGAGKRMGSSLPKQYLEVAGKSLLQHSLERLGLMLDFEKIVLAADAGDEHLQTVLSGLPPKLARKVVVVEGGVERMNSVLNALTLLEGLASAKDWVLVHDAVRPCVRAEDVTSLVESLQDEPAGGLLGLPVRDTVKLAAAGGGYVDSTLDRSKLWLALTPQMFRFGILRQALEQAEYSGLGATDEAAAVEKLGLPVRLVQGHSDNIKITFPEDMLLAATLLGNLASENS